MQSPAVNRFRELPHVIGYDGSAFRYMRITPNAVRSLIGIAGIRKYLEFRGQYRTSVPQLTFGREIDFSEGFLTPTGNFEWYAWAMEDVERPEYERALLELPTKPHIPGARVRLAQLAHEARLAEYAQQLEHQARKRMPLYLITQGPNEMRFGSACTLAVCIAHAGEKVEKVESGIFIDEDHKYVTNGRNIAGPLYRVNGSTQGVPYVKTSMPMAEVIALPLRERTASRVA